MSLFDRLLPGRPVDTPEAGFVRRLMSGYSYSTPGQPYAVNWDTERIVKDGYERVIWVWRGVDAIARRQADLTIRAVEVERLHDDNKKFHEDPLLHLLNVRPNAHENAWNFRYRLSSLAVLSKKGVPIEVMRNRMGAPAALAILPIDRTSPIPADTTAPGWSGETMQGWETWTANGERRELPVYRPDAPDVTNSVVWVRLPHPTDPLSGTTPLEAAGISIDLDFWARLYNRNFLMTDGRPGGVLAVQGQMDEAVAEELRSRFNGGPGAAGRTTVLEAQEISWVDTSTNPRDAQYVESRSITKEDILQALGVPETITGNASGRTYDNANAERAIFWEETEVPHCGMIARGLEALTLGGDEDGIALWHDTSNVGPLQLAKIERQRALLEELDKGGITIDEYRASTGKTPMLAPGSDVLWLPAGKLPIGKEHQKAADLRSAGQGEKTDPVEQARALATVGRENERERILDPIIPNPPELDSPTRTPVVTQAPPGTHLQAVKSLPDHGTGVMVALHLSGGDALALAGAAPLVEGSTPTEPDSYHVTLAYLGDIADGELSPVDLQRAAGAVESAVAAADPGPLTARISAVTSWEAGSREAVVALVDAPGLDRLRDAVVDALEAADVQVSATHGFTPHLTLAYAEGDGGLTIPPHPGVRGMELTLDHLAITVAGRRASLRLGQGPLQLKSGDTGIPEHQRHGGWIWQGRAGGDGPSLSGRRWHPASHHLTPLQMQRLSGEDHSGDDLMGDLVSRLGHDDELDPIDLHRLANWYRERGVARTADYLERQSREAHAADEVRTRAGRPASEDLEGAKPWELGKLEPAPGGHFLGTAYLQSRPNGRVAVFRRGDFDVFNDELRSDAPQIAEVSSIDEARTVVSTHPDLAPNREQLRRNLDNIQSYRGEPSTYESAFPEVRFRERGGSGDEEDGEGPAPGRNLAGLTRREVLAEADRLGLTDALSDRLRELAPSGRRTQDPVELDRLVFRAWDELTAEHSSTLTAADEAKLRAFFKAKLPRAANARLDEALTAGDWDAVDGMIRAAGDGISSGQISMPTLGLADLARMRAVLGRRSADPKAPDLSPEQKAVTMERQPHGGALIVEALERKSTTALSTHTGVFTVELPGDLDEGLRLPVLDLFDRQQRTVLARLGGTKARRGTRHWDPPGTKALDPRYVLDLAKWEAEVRAAIIAPMLRVLRAGRAQVATFYGDAQPAPMTEAEEQAYAAPLIERVVALLRARFERLVELVGKMESEGANLADIEAAVDQAYAERDQWAQSAAAEAALAGYNAGALQGALRTPQPLEKMWLSMRDDRVRESHAEADGQVRGLSEPFDLGDVAMMTPGDPSAPIEEWINCRCVMAFFRSTS